jgi:hypothetical protein
VFTPARSRDGRRVGLTHPKPSGRRAASVPDGDGRKLSGTVYRPTVGNSTVLGSLGVHEHWNNSTDRECSPNLDPVNGKGIELILTEPGDTTLPEAGSPPTGDSGNPSVSDSATPGDSSSNSAHNDDLSPDGDPVSGGCSCRLAVPHRGGLPAIGLALACIAVLRLRRGRDQSCMLGARADLALREIDLLPVRRPRCETEARRTAASRIEFAAVSPASAPT